MNQRVTSPWTGVLLCAGFGTRLRPLTNFIPKPLVPVGDLPLAQFAVERLVAAGASALKLNAFHLSSQVLAFAQELQGRLRIDVECSLESELLGTAGGIAAMALGERTSVVWNGDIFAPDLSLDWVNERGVDVPTLVVSPRLQKRGFQAGTVGLDADGYVVRLRGERFGNECSSADYIGVAGLPPVFTAQLPRLGCLVADALLPWLRGGNRVRAELFDGYWSDGGTLRDYWEQNRHWLQRTSRTHYTGPDATWAPGVVLRDAIVGSGAHVWGAGLLERVVVLPGARATAPLSDAIVAPNGQVISVVEGAP